ncbi:MAG: hypothetical protein IH845_04905 [Nanoarchaeota archaeon]|nr:hypothetical protein [Nanoarchaeota archaeon]
MGKNLDLIINKIKRNERRLNKIIKNNEKNAIDFYNNLIAGTVAGVGMGIFIFFINIGISFLNSILLTLFFPPLGWMIIKNLMRKSKVNKKSQLKHYLLNYMAGIISGIYVLSIVSNLGSGDTTFSDLLIPGGLFTLLSLIAWMFIVRFDNKRKSSKKK